MLGETDTAFAPHCTHYFLPVAENPEDGLILHCVFCRIERELVLLPEQESDGEEHQGPRYLLTKSEEAAKIRAKRDA